MLSLAWDFVNNDIYIFSIFYLLMF
jgi:hypothetical protein